MDDLGTSPSDNKFIDEITMKLLANKTNYAKYLYKTDNDRYEEQQQFIEDCKNFQYEIISMTKDMCKNKENEFGSEVNESFNNYARTIIRYLEVKQRSEHLQKEYQEQEIMKDDEPFPLETESINDDENQSYSTGTMDMFVRRK